MVTRLKSANIVWIDLACGAAFIALGAAIVWYVTGPWRHGDVVLETLSGSVRRSRGDLAELKATLDERRIALASLRERLATEGAMPSRTPVEKDLTTLSSLAQASNVGISRVTPLPGQEYPGLLELRYSCEAGGTIPSIMRFLQAVETHPFWMDIGYLDLRQSRQRSVQGDDTQSLSFVVSLFSSTSSTEHPAKMTSSQP